MLLAGFPRLRDPSVPAEDAFAGTFHVNETYTQLEAAFARRRRGAGAVAGSVRDLLSFPDRPEHPRPAGGVEAHTLTLFALQMPARLFEAGGDALAREAGRGDAAVARLGAGRTDRGLHAAHAGRRAVPGVQDAARPRDASWRLPRGNIFHRDLAWPFAEDEIEAGTWGTETGDRQRPPRRRRRAPGRQHQRHSGPQRRDGDPAL